MASGAQQIGGEKQAEPPGYPRFPAFHGDQLAVVVADRLCIGQIEEGSSAISVRPLGDLTRVESVLFSRSGRFVVCSAEVGYNTDVYRVEVSTGESTRLTWHPDEDLCASIEPPAAESSSASVLFRSGRDHPLRSPELYRVPISGGTPEPLRLGPVAAASSDPESSGLVFCPGTQVDRSWSGYRGGAAQDLWWLDPDGSIERLVERDASSDFAPTIGASGLFFLSDQLGALDLYQQPLHVGANFVATRLTRNHEAANKDDAARPFPPRWPSSNSAPDDPRVVFIQGREVCVVHPVTAEIRRYSVEVDDPVLFARPVSRALLAETLSIAVDDGADSITCAGRGGAVRMSIGQIDEIVSPDLGADGVEMMEGGRVLVGRIDEEGFLLYAIGEDGAEEEVVRSKELPGSYDISRDGSSIALSFLDGRVVVSRVGGSETRLVPGVRFGRFSTMEWSPDGALLALTSETSDLATVLHLYDWESERIEIVGDGLAADIFPSFDPSGHYLFFASSKPSPNDESSYAIRALPLKATTPPPIPMELEAAGFGSTVFWSAERNYSADLVGIQQRVRTLNRAGEANLVWLAATQGGIAWTEVPEDDEGATSGGLYAGPSSQVLRWLSFDDEEAFTVMNGVSLTTRSPSGDRVAYLMEHEGVSSLNVWSPDEETYDTFADASVARISISAAVEARRVLAQAWVLLRGGFFDREKVGPQWEAAYRRHAALAESIRTGAERVDLLQQMLKELDASHLEVGLREDLDAPAPGSMEEAWYDSWDSLLGVEHSSVESGIRIDRILRSGSLDGGISPLDRPWTGLSDGWQVSQVDGIPVSDSTNLYSLLVGRETDDVELTLTDPEGTRSRQIVRGMDASASEALRYEDWRRRLRERTAVLSDGDVGYVHLAHLDEGSPEDLIAQLQGQLGRRGLVLDIRGNGGGFHSPEILRTLMIRGWAVDVDRYGVIGGMPSDAFQGDLALLVDEEVASDGEYLTILFRQLGLGPVIGVRTAGWLSGIEEMQLVDGTELWLPTVTSRSEEIGMYPEGLGVEPDIVAHKDPADYFADRDPPLERAVAWILEQPVREGSPRKPAAVDLNPSTKKNEGR